MVDESWIKVDRLHGCRLHIKCRNHWIFANFTWMLLTWPFTFGRVRRNLNGQLQCFPTADFGTNGRPLSFPWNLYFDSTIIVDLTCDWLNYCWPVFLWVHLVLRHFCCWMAFTRCFKFKYYSRVLAKYIHI